MNVTQAGRSPPPFCDNLSSDDATAVPNLASPIVRLPVNIYILHMIVSGHLVTAKFYALLEATFEIFICLYDSLNAIVAVCSNSYLVTTKKFLLGFLVTGHPCLLTLICVDRFLAVVAPVLFLRLKPLRYKASISGIICLCTLFSCWCGVFMTSEFYYFLVVQIVACCAVKLCCCVATLVVLKRSGPGEGVGQRKGASEARLKAFRIVFLTTLSVIFMYVPLVGVIFFKRYLTHQQFLNMLGVCYTCASFCGFIRAVLFLHRSGKHLS